MRKLMISEEFGIFHVQSSSGIVVAGRDLGSALMAATRAAGVAGKLRVNASERRTRGLENEPDIWGDAAELFELLCPAKPKLDVPLST